MTNKALNDQEGDVVYTVVDSVGVIRLNRPSKLNAISPAMARSLTAILGEAESDPDVRALVIHGAGERGFCAGADLSVMMHGEGDQLATDIGGHFGIIRYPRSKPLIGALHGYTVAGGLELALACDMLIAERGVVFGLPELKRGILPNGGGLTRLSAQIPQKVAYEVIFAGRQLTGEEALSFGLINRLVEPGLALGTAIEIGNGIGSLPAGAVATAHRMMRVINEGTVEPLWDLGVIIASSLRKGDQARQLARDFIEKR